MLGFLRVMFICGFLLAICTSARADDAPPQLGAYTFAGTTLSLLGDEAASNFEDIIPKDEDISWQVYVPETYSPDRPAGVVIYISPSNSGAIPEDWAATLKDQNLIWVSADNSGNQIDPRRRVIYPIFATAVIANTYRINSDRIYLTGFSGGGRIASIAASEYPHIFKGAIYMSGVNFWNKSPSLNLEQIRSNAYVFITGRGDFNFQDTKKVHRLYKRNKVRHLSLNTVAGLKHELPDSEAVRDAILFLDARGE